MYKMFLDDERFPVTEDYVIVRSSQEAKEYILRNGVPGFISFDHDLGGNDTAMHVVHWLIEQHLDGNLSLTNLKYQIHSQNPIGKHNIESLLEAFLTFERNKK